MKSVDIETTSLDICVNSAQSERIVLTRDGQPIALVVGVEGLDADQVELGSSDAFWQVIGTRRQQSTLKRDELERKIDSFNPPKQIPQKPHAPETSESSGQ